MTAIRYAIAMTIGILIGVAIARADTDLPGQVNADRVRQLRHCWGGSVQVFGRVIHRQSNCVRLLWPDQVERVRFYDEDYLLLVCGAYEGGREFDGCVVPLDDWRDENGEPWTQEEIYQSFGWDVGIPKGDDNG